MIGYILSNQQLIGYGIACGCLIQIFIFFVRNRVLPDLRGKDRSWQFLEVSGVVWLYLFPALAVSSLFGLEVPTGVWSTMDIVYFINILGRNANRLIEARFGIPPEQKENQPPA